ncbi:p-loop containing nucleoside triphosphate hydrolase [Pleurostoma richardsiae]|uniref:P-loop containing nucleoside triphosphate hydrolase n=1 Tax=Pleurostoma richardsiae TaxID=41990 RepID=A0AA38RYL6_9PEZI|nr:p-loop containing nucleoside triphosphate hydrolase [Pleurostoma richardsiae]
MAADPEQFALWLSASCAILFLAYLPARIWDLAKQAPCGLRRYHVVAYRAKLSIGPALAMALLILSLRPRGQAQPASLSDAGVVTVSLSALVAICLSPLFHLEHRRSLTAGSDLAILYLVGSLIFDMVILTMPRLGPRLWEGLPGAVRVRCVAHALLLLLECLVGPPAAKGGKGLLSDEETSGVLSRVFFSWINPLLTRGYRHVLTAQGLSYLSQDLKPSHTRRAVLEAWSRRAVPESRMTLPLVLYRCLKRQFFAAVIPRLFLIVFRYAQPILIWRAIHYVTVPASGDWESTGYWLIVAALIVYMGLVVSTARYQHAVNRLRLSTKSALVGLIHAKMISLPSTAREDGEAITLMSTDAEGLENIVEMFHETWAQVLEVAIGMTLLAREVGWLWLLLVVLIYLCSRMSRHVAGHLHPGQKAWNVASQTRIAATTIMLNSMKVVKMLGIESALAERIQRLRERELRTASKVRWLMVYANSAANALGIFSPAIVIAIFAAWLQHVRNASLNAETGFTTLAVLSRVTHPANMVMTIVPRAVGAFAGFERIQEYLVKPALTDRRLVARMSTPRYPITTPSDATSLPAAPALHLEHTTVGYPPTEDQAVLKDVSMEVARGSFVVVSGPVGCGKSTLLLALLGELPPLKGSVAVSTKRIAYCSQKPWLPAGNIREVITGFADQYDVQQYREVLKACCLEHDLDILPESDDTYVGSRGHNLSGGQRQRVALARAVFARCEIVLLDDAFSALDGETEHRVFENLLGARGVLRRSGVTVVLVSNNAKHCASADSVVLLSEGGRVKEQGLWRNIQTKTSQVPKFMTRRGADTNAPMPATDKNLEKLGTRLRALNEAERDLARRTGDIALYRYFCSFADYRNLALLAACTASYSLFVTIPQYWVELWTESDSSRNTFYIAGLMLLAFLAWGSTSGTLWAAIVLLARRAGLTLHRHLLGIVTRAPLTFFSMTDTGSILNRFGQDMQLIDKQLPMAVTNVCNQVFKLTVQAVLLFLAQKWLVVSLPAVLAVVYVVQKIYLRTSRQLRFLELEAKAAVFSSFLEAFDGLETLRGFSWQRQAIISNERGIEDAQRPEFLLLTLQRWLNLVLDLLSAALGVIVIVIATMRREDVSGGQVGVALNVMLAANLTLLRLVESWTTLEISLGAVARLKMLGEHTPSEAEAPSEAAWGGAAYRGPDLWRNWRIDGSIEMRDVVASYHPGALALRGVSLAIRPGQKVLVRGRTGSGKSSLLLTLLRMLNLESGSITLDGVDISNVPPHELRLRCFVVASQDPLLLPQEELRFNLDPSGSASDAMIVQALTMVGLWSIFQGNSPDAILTRESSADNADSGFAVLGSPLLELPALSGGQGQLFALARAIVKATGLRATGSRPIVLLDEVTSSVDTDTEAKVFDIVDREFTSRDHTVVIVTHRSAALSSRMRPGKDVVVDMSDGVVTGVTEDITQALLQQD